MNTQDLFARRLKSARLMKGYSLQDLADAIDNKLTRQSLHRYEKGDVMPGDDILALLADALDVNIDFFFRETEVHIDKVEFRKNRNMTVKQQDMIKEKTKEYLGRYLEVEEILGVTEIFKNPIESFGKIYSYEDADRAAVELRKEWNLGMGPLFNVMELLEDNNIKIVELDSDDEFDGLQTCVNDNIPVIAFNRSRYEKMDRLRFTLLHELGHLLMDFEPNLDSRLVERYCNRFAAAMLIPEKTLKKELGEHRQKLSIVEIGNIKKQYGISMQSIIIKAKEAGIINQNYCDSLLFMFEQHNWKVDEPVDYEGVEEINRFQQLIFRAYIEEQITMSKAAALLDIPLAEFRKKHARMI